MQYTEDIPLINNDEEATIAVGPWRLPTLYKYDVNQRKRLWRIMFDTTELISESGIVGGKLLRSTSIVKLTTRSKNLSHQAYIVANGKYTKKVKEGLMLEDAISVFQPGNYNLAKGKIAMLAHHYNENKLDEQFSVQRKYDGLRCRARLDPDSNNVDLIKRGGDPISYCNLLKRIFKVLIDKLYYLNPSLEPGWQFDGELYNHDLALNQIEGIVNRSVNVHEDENKLYFYVFDLIPPSVNTENAQYYVRRTILDTLFNRIKNSKLVSLTQYVKLAKEYHCNDPQQIEEMHDQFVQEGYEGAIVKSWYKDYVISRTYNIMKYVKFNSIEATIVGFDKAKGTEEGAIIFTIKLPNGLTQGTRPTGTIENRCKMYDEGDKYIGKSCTVRFKDYTNTNRLHAPVLYKINS